MGGSGIEIKSLTHTFGVGNLGNRMRPTLFLILGSQGGLLQIASEGDILIHAEVVFCLAIFSLFVLGILPDEHQCV